MGALFWSSCSLALVLARPCLCLLLLLVVLDDALHKLDQISCKYLEPPELAVCSGVDSSCRSSFEGVFYEARVSRELPVSLHEPGEQFVCFHCSHGVSGAVGVDYHCP